MNIVSIVEGYGIKLKKVGNLYLGLCPFHNDVNNPNLTLYPHTNSFHCWSCKTSGDIYWFIALMEGISINEVKSKYRHIVLKKKLGSLSNKTTVNFKEETQILLANMVYTTLQSHCSILPKVVEALQKVDDILNTSETISYTKGVMLVEKLGVVLYNYHKESI